MLRRLVLSKLDHLRLAEVLRKSARESTSYVRAELSTKLRRAELCDPHQIPPQLVTMNSRALLLADYWQVPREFSLVYPHDANCLDDRVSVMSPLGVQLLGAEEGVTLPVWDKMRSFRIC